MTGGGRIQYWNPTMGSSAVLSGFPPGPHRIQGIGAGFIPSVLNRDIIDEVLACTDDDAIATAHLAAAREGLLAGISGGAALWGALEVARRLSVGQECVRKLLRGKSSRPFAWAAVGASTRSTDTSDHAPSSTRLRVTLPKFVLARFTSG